MEEEDILYSSDCSSWTSYHTINSPAIGPGPFTGLFIVSGCGSASALVINHSGIEKTLAENADR